MRDYAYLCRTLIYLSFHSVEYLRLYIDELFREYVGYVVDSRFRYPYIISTDDFCIVELCRPFDICVGVCEDKDKVVLYIKMFRRVVKRVIVRKCSYGRCCKR